MYDRSIDIPDFVTCEGAAEPPGGPFRGLLSVGGRHGGHRVGVIHPPFQQIESLWVVPDGSFIQRTVHHTGGWGGGGGGADENGFPFR